MASGVRIKRVRVPAVHHLHGHPHRAQVHDPLPTILIVTRGSRRATRTTSCASPPSCGPHQPDTVLNRDAHRGAPERRRQHADAMLGSSCQLERALIYLLFLASCKLNNWANATINVWHHGFIRGTEPTDKTHGRNYMVASPWFR
jgi:hypothetical protein